VAELSKTPDWKLISKEVGLISSHASNFSIYKKKLVAPLWIITADYETLTQAALLIVLKYEVKKLLAWLRI